MAKLTHLPLKRLEHERPRKKRQGFGNAIKRNASEHGKDLFSQIAALKEKSPALKKDTQIFKVQLAEKSSIDDAEWERSGLYVLREDEGGKVFVAASDPELSQLQQRLQKYESWDREKPPDSEQKNPPHTNFFGNIEAFEEPLSPDEKIGPHLHAANVRSIADITAQEYVADIELFHVGDRTRCETIFMNVFNLIKERGGEVSDSYIGDSLILLRARLSGDTLTEILKLDTVIAVDLPPRVSLAITEAAATSSMSLPNISPPPPNAPSVAIIDSGITPGHPLLEKAVGEAIAVPETLGEPHDEAGHGTAIAGLSLYGSVAECLSNGKFAQRIYILSARVVNSEGRFDDRKLVDTQMREAIRYFNKQYGCRIFNLSLGDPTLPFGGGKVSTWATALDELARELDIVIVVSAGNFFHSPPRAEADTILSDYPNYLFTPEASIVEPATGALVVTVGSLSHTANLTAGLHSSYVGVRPISQVNQPSPFTRCGPGVSNSIKPDLCEYGGNCAYDGGLRWRVDPNSQVAKELGVLSLNHKYLENLFHVHVGTSRAAPVIAHKAALILEAFPDASSNLIRALLASSARVPPETVTLFDGDRAKILRSCGHGRPDLTKAISSEESRAVMYSEEKVPIDAFHVYEIPIPADFAKARSRRSISITLAFDPPVRRTRLDYMGTSMSFRLLRGKSVDEIVEAFRHRGTTEAKVARLTGGKYECKMYPLPTEREGGTLQKGIFTMSQETDYGLSYYLVVSCARLWAPREYYLVSKDLL